jgi:hypothetical protein
MFYWRISDLDTDGGSVPSVSLNPLWLLRARSVHSGQDELFLGFGAFGCLLTNGLLGRASQLGFGSEFHNLGQQH